MRGTESVWIITNGDASKVNGRFFHEMNDPPPSALAPFCKATRRIIHDVRNLVAADSHDTGRLRYQINADQTSADDRQQNANQQHATPPMIGEMAGSRIIHRWDLERSTEAMDTIFEKGFWFDRRSWDGSTSRSGLLS